MIIFLIGMPGSGKSYWMERLAERLRYRAVDMDMDIVERSGKTIPELFAVGESHFREEERESLQRLIVQYPDQVVMATGGGAPCYKDNMAIMKATGCVLYLETALESLVSHIEQQQLPRPLLVNGSKQELTEKLAALYKQRKEIYEQAHGIIHADSATLATFADAITQYVNDQNSTGS